MFNDHRSDQNVLTETVIDQSAPKVPLYSGGIGMATWDTEAEYKDFEVIQGGKVVYKSDFINRADEWKPVLGTWKVKDSAYAQTAMGAQRFAWLPGKSFDTYTLKLKARRTSNSTNAFIVPFAVKDDKTMMRLHIGSNVNSNSVFESVNNGFQVADLVNQKRLPARIETGRWYDITIEVGVDKIDSYLDGKPLISFTEPNKLFSIAGLDNKTGEVIVKVVNASNQPYKTNLQIKGVELSGTAELTTLTADAPTSENSMAEPTKYVPQKNDFE
jgi:alpha-L-arabinofuranosidase